MSNNLFVKNVDKYVRDIDLLTAWHRDMATGISLVKGIPYEKALDYVKDITSSGARYEIKDPHMKYVGRDAENDREVKVTTFFKYLKNIDTHKLIVSPSLAVYKNKEQEESFSAIYISKNVKKRSKSKKEMFQAKEIGDKALAEFKNLEQNNAKIKNNALSGAHCSKSTILFIDTIHSSLTSLCRSASGYGNSNNEKITCGNRHYWCPEIVTSNILNVINTADEVQYVEAVSKYNLHIPTVNEVMDIILYSTKNYWRDDRIKSIETLVNSLTDIQRVMFSYTSDLYHLMKFNDELMRKWLGNLARRVTTPVEDPKQYLNGLTEECESLVSMICGSYMDGSRISDFSKFSEDLQMMLGATAKNVKETMSEFELLTKVILVSECMPPTLANLPHILRRGAIASDTDSTIFTVQDWLKWYTPDTMHYNEETISVGHSIAFLASSTITHVLAKMSANIGIAKTQLYQYAMKSEYWFPVFALTSRAKTYFALRGAQEGLVFKPEDVEIEIKGAVLKGSNAPKEIIDDSKALIIDLLTKTRKGDLIDAAKVLKHVADIERGLFSKIKCGSPEFFKKLEIKEEDTYKKGPYQSNYFHYLLWNSVFADKYGACPEPPYAAIRITLDTSTKGKFNDYLESITDEPLKERLLKCLADGKKNMLTSVAIPKSHADSHGIPSEVINGINIRAMVANIMESHYVVLETLGWNFMESNKLRLVSDEY
jgi:hypothetical protein